MQGVIPAAGRGTRLRPRTDDRPKALVPVGGQPLLSHVFDTLAPHVEAYIVVVGYLGDRIREHYGQSHRRTEITYVEQRTQEGIADAILRAEPVVDGPFLQLNGDNVLRGNVGDAVTRHLETAADATLLVDRVSAERARRGGVLDIEGGEVVGIVEKPDDPPSRVATTGCFAFSERVFEACRRIDRSERGEFELTDAIGWLLADGGRIETVRLDGWRVNVNTPADIERVEATL